MAVENILRLAVAVENILRLAMSVENILIIAIPVENILRSALTVENISWRWWVKKQNFLGVSLVPPHCTISVACVLL